MQSRREFMKKAAVGSVGMAMSGSVYGLSAKSYNRIIGANELIRIAPSVSTVGYKGVVAMQLGNIAWRVGRDLKIDPQKRSYPRRQRRTEAVEPGVPERLETQSLI